MRIFMWCAKLFFVWAAIVSTSVAQQGHREHSAHEHGAGKISVVVEADEVLLTLEVPAVHAVGFEHEAHTEAERAAAEQSLQNFSAGNELFVFGDDAGCRLESYEAELAGQSRHEPSNAAAKKASHGHKDDHKDDHKGHKDEHKGHKDDHKDGHAKHEQDESAPTGAEHSDLHAQYVFHCARAQAVKQIDVDVFRYLKGIDELAVQVVTERNQKLVRISPKRARIDLGGGG